MPPPRDDQPQEILASSMDALEDGDRGAVERACREWPRLGVSMWAAASVMAEIQAARAAPPADGVSASTPETIGRFRVLGLLGQGGMGLVFRAHDPTLEREVALKVQPTGVAAAPGAADRFRREARALAQIRHPHIVAVHDIGETAQGLLYFAMDLVEGKPLAQILDTAADLGLEALRSNHLLPEPADAKSPATGPYLEAAVRLVAKIADALQHAHQEGITHRDVKPSNLLVDRAGEPHLVDFGIARAVDNPAATAADTLAGAGTPAYMAPEQISEDGTIGPWTDVYALGVVLYELITLQRPFAGTTNQQVLRRILETEPMRPRKLNRRIPRDLETICLVAMQKDPRRRYSSARALDEDLARLQAHRPIRARAPGALARFAIGVRRNPWPMAAAGIALLAGAAGVLGHGLIVSRDRALALAHVEQAQRLMIGEAVDAGVGHPFEAAIEHLRLANELVPSEAPGQELIEDILRARAARDGEDMVTAAIDRCRDLRRTGGDLRALEVLTQAVLDQLNELALVAPDAEALDRKIPEILEERRLLSLARREPLDADAEAFDARAGDQGKGTIAVSGGPPGARVHLFRYEERTWGGAIRHVPLPFPEATTAGVLAPGDAVLVVQRVTSGGPAAQAGISVGDLLLANADASISAGVFDQRLPEAGLALRVLSDGILRNLTLRGDRHAGIEARATAYPLPCAPWNLVGTLPHCSIAVEPGSYLLLVRSEQHEDLRLPVCVGAPRERMAVQADLEPSGTSPHGFVFVPAGEFLAGGGGTARPVQRRWLEDYWIGREEVGSGDYLEFLHDPGTRADIERARKGGRWIRLPRARGFGDSEVRVIDRLLWRLREDGSYETDRDLRLPVSGISCADCEAYCRWKTERANARGERWLFRLPTEDEWEKAARGVDGRDFPWGARFDASLCWMTSPLRAKGSAAQPPPQSGPLGDESPFGVRDTAGGVLEWCAGRYLGTPMRPWRSGAWGNEDPAYSRCASSNGGLHWRVDAKDGFRMVAVRRGQ